MIEQSFLTREGLKKLEEELLYLRNTRRIQVADRLHKAMEDGEVEENAEYEDAKNEQSFVEGRIQELEALLSRAVVIEDQQRHNGMVNVGSKVTIAEDGQEPEVYTIVGPAEADPKAGLISNQSPLGRALLEHKRGEWVKVNAPVGVLTFQVLAVE